MTCEMTYLQCCYTPPEHQSGPVVNVLSMQGQVKNPTHWVNVKLGVDSKQLYLFIITSASGSLSYKLTTIQTSSIDTMQFNAL